MELKEDVRDSVPKPFDLARFLAATMTFMSHLKTTTVFFDGNDILKIVKSREEPRGTGIPSNMKSITEGKTMTIATISVISEWLVALSTCEAY